MKLHIVTSVILVGLIALFGIVVCRDFNRQEEAISANTRPASSSESPKATIATEKSGEQITIEEEIPERIASANNIESAPPKSSEVKPAPAAVPIVTKEEAEKLNEEALEYAITEKEKREPFFRMYQNSKIDRICFEGTVRATSIIPDPTKSDYDNCLYTIFVEIDSVLSKVQEDKNISHGIIVVAPIMKDKVILQVNKFSLGDKVLCISGEYDAMPQSIQEIQVSDDLQLYELQQYYPFSIKKIAAFSKDGNRSFAKREITILPIQSCPKDENAEIIRRERIKSEIARIEADLRKYDNSFDKWKQEYESITGQYNKLVDEKFMGWINDSYFAVGGEFPEYNTREYINGILPYKKFLEKNNIDLIILRIPNKWEFARCVLAAEMFQEDPAWTEHYYECLKNDIEIVDPLSAMWEHRFDFPLTYFYNVQSEPHPAEGQAFVSAMVLSDVLRRYSFPLSKQPIKLEEYVLETTDKRYFWPKGNDKYDPKKNISFKRVVREGKTIGGLHTNTGSPFIFLSNSFFWFPQRDQGASVPGYTAFFIQHIPDWIYQNGGHNPMIRNLVAKPSLLNQRKAVIMVGHPDDWKESFPSIPKYISDKAIRLTHEKTIKAFSDEITIDDNNTFICSVDKSEAVLFAPNNIPIQQEKEFDMSFKISNIEGKMTCMIRLNFDKASHITINLTKNGNKETIDTCTLGAGRGQYADLFLPLSDDNDVTIRISPTKPWTQESSIKNIELWYY